MPVPETIGKKPFDIQEAAVLLDTYLANAAKGGSLTTAAETASIRLRALALKNGLLVPEGFRSPQGLLNRLRSLAAIFNDKEVESAPATAVFTEIVSIYRNDHARYEELLRSSMTDTPNSEENQHIKEMKPVADVMRENGQDFFQWLQGKLSESEVSDIQRSFKMMSTLLIRSRVLPRPITDITDANLIGRACLQVKKAFSNKRLRNTASRTLAMYYEFLNEPVVVQESTVEPEPVTEIEEPSVDVQDNWIRFDFSNSQQFERTRPAYCSVNGSPIEGRNWARILIGITEREMAAENPAIALLYESSLLAEKKNRPYIMKERIEGLNCSQLSNGYWVNVNYSIPRLMELIKALCLRCGYSEEQVILYGVPRGTTVEKKEKEPQQSSSGNGVPIELAEQHLRSIGIAGATVNEITSAVQPDAAVWPTTLALDESPNVVSMPGKKYVLADCFVDLDEAEETLGSILKTHFAQFEGYSNNQLLFGAASQELFLFLNDNDCENVEAVYAIARYLFEKKAAAGHPYKFSWPHIFETEPDYPMTLRGLMIHLARSNGGILNVMDAKDYLQKTKLTYGGMGQLLQLSSANTFLIYDSDRYLLSEALGIDDAWCRQMHDRLGNLFQKANVAYVIPRDITSTWLSTLPLLPRGMAWTPLLLQEVIQKYPAIGFKAITADLSQSLDRLAAAFVPEGSPLQSFPDVVTLYMEEKHKGELPLRMAGEDLRLELREAGMLENSEMIYALPKALDDYRFAWTDENKTVYVRGNK